MILGGGPGNELWPLTATRAEPAVPFGGSFRLIDIPLSNCINSGLNTMYVLTQYNSTSLNRHLSRGAFCCVFFLSACVSSVGRRRPAAQRQQ